MATKKKAKPKARRKKPRTLRQAIIRAGARSKRRKKLRIPDPAPPQVCNGIGWAILQMQQGLAVRRKNWNGPGQALRLQIPDPYSKMSLPYVYIRTVQGQLVPWLASQTDLLATDWEIAD